MTPDWYDTLVGDWHRPLHAVVDVLPVELRGEAQGGNAAAARAVERFCKGIVDAVAPYVVRRTAIKAGVVARDLAIGGHHDDAYRKALIRQTA